MRIGKRHDPCREIVDEMPDATWRIRSAVERANARIVVIDSLTGYLNAMSEEQHLILQMHEILTYMNQKGIVTILLLANHGLIGQMVAPVDMTYLPPGRITKSWYPPRIWLPRILITRSLRRSPP